MKNTFLSGWKWAAYDTIIDMGGIMAEDDYHYTANDTGTNI